MWRKSDWQNVLARTWLARCVSDAVLVYLLSGKAVLQVHCKATAGQEQAAAHDHVTVCYEQHWDEWEEPVAVCALSARFLSWASRCI